jgi:regulator of sigma E protease
MLIALAAISFVLGAVVAAVAFVAFRYATLRALGIHDIRLAVGVAPVWRHEAAPPYARAATVFAGVLGVYLVGVVFAFVGALTDGQISRDERSMRVDVALHGPAGRAGIRRGDRIVSLDGVNVRSWDEVRAGVKGRARDEVTVVIARNGAEKAVIVSLGKDGADKLQVAPMLEPRAVGIGEALGTAVAQPFVPVVEKVRGVMDRASDRENSDVLGKVGITREVADASGTWLGRGLRLAAALISYGLIVVVVLSHGLTPRRAPA